MTKNQVLEFRDLVQLVPFMSCFESEEGKVITEEFNQRCDLGLEIEYIEDSQWRFQDEFAAAEALETIRYQDAKRISD